MMEDFLQTGGVNHSLSFSLSSISSFYVPHAPWGMIAPRQLRPMSSSCRPSEQPEVAKNMFFGVSPWNLLKLEAWSQEMWKPGKFAGLFVLAASWGRPSFCWPKPCVAASPCGQMWAGHLTSEVHSDASWCFSMVQNKTAVELEMVMDRLGWWWVVPLPSTSHHQDYIFCRVIPTWTFIYANITGKGG